MELREALKDLPGQFGEGHEIKFVDPNYWYDRIEASQALLENFLAKVDSCPDVTDSAYGAREYRKLPEFRLPDDVKRSRSGLLI